MPRLYAIGFVLAFLSGCSATSSGYDPERHEQLSSLNAMIADLEKPSSATPSGNDGWEEYGAWRVKLFSDDMNAVSHVRLYTSLNDTSRKDGLVIYESVSFGFEIFDGTLVTLSPGLELMRRNQWPQCDLNTSMISIDGDKPRRLVDKENIGLCASIDGYGRIIQRLMDGQKAMIRMAGIDGSISLVGFKEAWFRAMSMAD